MDPDDLQQAGQGPTSTNIQDLLNSLRTSAAWAQVVGAAPAAEPGDRANEQAHTSSHESYETEPPTFAHHVPSTLAATSSSSYTSQPSVAALLSQLQASSGNVFTSHVTPQMSPMAGQRVEDSTPPTPESGLRPESRILHAATPNQSQQKDFRTMTFQKSLSHVAALAEDEAFVQAMKSMKEEQDALERKLWEERSEILGRHDQKVQAAKAKAQIIGAGLSKLDADLLSDAVRQDMHKFEIERALPAWDGLVAKHQATMEILTVPAMFVTSKPADLQKQKKVMQLVEGTIHGDD